MNRLAGIELLRGVLMLMIVLVHLTGNGVMKSDAPIAFTEPNWFWANIIDAICYPAVNTFVLISGYFGIRLSLGRVLKLWVPVVFYSTCLFFIFDPFTLGGVFSSFLPIITKKYWFLTSYFLLMLLSPFLNSYIETINRTQLKSLLFWALLIFVIIPSVPSVSPHYRLADNHGMDVINFIVLYILGRSLALLKLNLSKAKSFLLYIISTVFSFSLTVLFAYWLGVNNGWKSMFYAYNNVFVYLQAIGLFFLFKQFNIGNKLGRIINWLAPSFFFVYIIHSCPSIGENLYLWISSPDYYYSNMFVLHTIGWGFIIFSACIIIDIITRRLLFKPILSMVINLIQLGIGRAFNKCFLKGGSLELQ